MTILKIICRFFSIYLAKKDLERPITGSITGRSTEGLSWLDSGKNKDPKELLKIYSLREYPQCWIKVSLIVEIKQNGSRFSSNSIIQIGLLTR